MSTVEMCRIVSLTRSLPKLDNPPTPTGVSAHMMSLFHFDALVIEDVCKLSYSLFGLAGFFGLAQV